MFFRIDNFDIMKKYFHLSVPIITLLIIFFFLPHYSGCIIRTNRVWWMPIIAYVFIFCCKAFKKPIFLNISYVWCFICLILAVFIHFPFHPGPPVGIWKRNLHNPEAREQVSIFLSDKRIKYKLKVDKNGKQHFLYAKISLQFPANNTDIREELKRKKDILNKIVKTRFENMDASQLVVNNISKLKLMLLSDINGVLKNKVSKIYFKYYYVQ